MKIFNTSLLIISSLKYNLASTSTNQGCDKAQIFRVICPTKSNSYGELSTTHVGSICNQSQVIWKLGVMVLIKVILQCKII